MSSILTQARARVLHPGALPRPRLTIVPKVAARTPRIPFVVLVVGIMTTGLIGLLLLNTALERGAYQVTALQQSADALGVREQALTLQVAMLNDPQRVAAKARALGMVGDDRPAFLSVATGQVIGKPAPASAANTVDIGHRQPLSARHAKLTPPVAGNDNHLAVLVKEPPAPAPAGRKSHDTRAASTKPGAAGVTKDRSHTRSHR